MSLLCVLICCQFLHDLTLHLFRCQDLASAPSGQKNGSSGSLMFSTGQSKGGFGSSGSITLNTGDTSGGSAGGVSIEVGETVSKF